HGQTNLRLAFAGIRKAEVGEHVARTRHDFSATLRAWFCHIDPHSPVWPVLSAVPRVPHPVSVSEFPWAISSENSATHIRPNESERYRRRDTCFRRDLPQPPALRNPLPSMASPRGASRQIARCSEPYRYRL